MTIPIILVGKGRGIKEFVWNIEDINKEGKKFNLIGVVDDFKKDGVLGDVKWLIKNKEKLKKEYGEVFLVCTAGTPSVRKKLCNALEKHFPFANLINPSSKIHPSAKIGNGVIISDGCLISNDVVIENHVLLNFNVLFGHDVRIGRYTNCSPGTNVMGNVSIGEGNLIGAGVTIIPDITVGNNNVVGAGATLYSNFGDNNTIFGVPARALSKVKVGENTAPK